MFCLCFQRVGVISMSEDEINNLLVSKGINKSGPKEAEDDDESVEHEEGVPSQHDGNEL